MIWGAPASPTPSSPPPTERPGSRPAGFPFPERYQDQGGQLVEVAPPPILLEADLPLVITVQLDYQADWAIEVEEASCTIDVLGTAVALSSRYQVGPKPRVFSDGGRWIGASCFTPPLPAGGYTLQYGLASIGFTLPSETTQYCVHSDP